MGSGSWSKKDYVSYSTTMCRSVSTDGDIKGSYSAQEMFKERSLSPELNPFGVIRECVDSEEHPNTIPVILALDVTGSMGASAVEIAKKLNVIMTNLYENISDVEFMIMAIGDMVYDSAPLQVSQFESDVRIAEQLDKVYFEGGGGGNMYESYSAAWLFAARNTKLDCWKRGKKGLIITIGDELLNPYLPVLGVKKTITEECQGDVYSIDIFKELQDKYTVFHLNCISTASGSSGRNENVASFAKVIGKENVMNVTVDEISDKIIAIITDFSKDENLSENTGTIARDESGAITW